MPLGPIEREVTERLGLAVVLSEVHSMLSMPGESKRAATVGRPYINFGKI